MSKDVNVKRISFYIPRETYSNLKVWASKQGLSMSKVIVNLIKNSPKQVDYMNVISQRKFILFTFRINTDIQQKISSGKAESNLTQSQWLRSLIVQKIGM